jgi:hypothetical protein
MQLDCMLVDHNQAYKLGVSNIGLLYDAIKQCLCLSLELHPILTSTKRHVKYLLLVALMPLKLCRPLDRLSSTLLSFVVLYFSPTSPVQICSLLTVLCLSSARQKKRKVCDRSLGSSADTLLDLPNQHHNFFRKYNSCISYTTSKTRLDAAFQIMTDVAAVVAAAAGSRGIGFQGKLVSSANDVIYDGIGFDVETTDGVCVGVYSWSLQYIIIIIWA